MPPNPLVSSDFVAPNGRSRTHIANILNYATPGLTNKKRLGTPQQVGTRMLFEDYGGNLDADMRKKFLELLKSERYSRVCFCLRYPFHCYLEIFSSFTILKNCYEIHIITGFIRDILD